MSVPRLSSGKIEEKLRLLPEKGEHDSGGLNVNQTNFLSSHLP